MSIEANTLATSEEKTVGKCPHCGRDIVESDKGFICAGSNMPKETTFDEYLSSYCLFVLYKDCLRFVGKSLISSEEMKILLQGQAVPLNNLRRKDGQAFDCYGVLARVFDSKRWGIKFVNSADALSPNIMVLVDQVSRKRRKKG